MTNDNSRRTIEQLVAELETVSSRLRGEFPHFEMNRASGGWRVTAFVPPLNDTEVQIIEGENRFGVIEATAVDLDDALSSVLSICWAVDRDRAVTA